MHGKLNKINTGNGEAGQEEGNRRATKAYPGHTHRTRDTADGTRAAWRQSVAARLSQKSNRSQDRQRAAGDPDRQSDRRFHICAHMFVCTSVCVCVYTDM